MHKVVIEGKSFSGERSLFGLKDASLNGCEFLEGESPLKETARLDVQNCQFTWKYPLWYSKDLKVRRCGFYNEAHAGIWYTKDAEFEDCAFGEAKCFRHASGIIVHDCRFEKADETFWWCRDVKCSNSYFEGDYVFMQSSDLELDGVEIDGNYPFDGSKNVRLHNCVLRSKDAFWNSENILIVDSVIDGEYFGWNSHNITMRNCRIRSHQGFCYMDNVVLENCEISDSDLTFEYVSNASVDITRGSLDIKNPISGHFSAPAYDNIVLDDPKVDKTSLMFERK